ncbi:MAG TPA: hypothetical protein DEA40_15110 [Parvularcula sp.]|nr:hypothetical protein [Parvularcula sp.]HBS35706.1 hypothetical protein [Parvularcula sp.]
MTDRRKFLTTLPAAAAGVAATGSVAQAAVPSVPEAQTTIDITKRDAFPAAEVYSHLGEKLRFYEDLIENKIVMVNFMSIESEKDFPISKFIASVADQLGDKLGREIFINSITTDPAKDTPKALLAFAKKFGMRDGWRFITSTNEEVKALSTRLYRHPAHSITGKPRKVDIVFYGNGKAGVWGTFPTDIQPSDAAGRLAWVMPRERRAELTQAGPRRLDANAGLVSHNREI